MDYTIVAIEFSIYHRLYKGVKQSSVQALNSISLIKNNFHCFGHMMALLHMSTMNKTG